jgi:hypothetical protein
MRRFLIVLTADVDFVDGDDARSENFEKHMLEDVRAAAQRVSLRNVRGHKVPHAQIAEVKGTL